MEYDTMDMKRQDIMNKLQKHNKSSHELWRSKIDDNPYLKITNDGCEIT